MIDLTGKRFGKLVVLKRSENSVSPSGSKYTMWECKCDCGNTKTINANSLKRGISKSCGCASRGINRYIDNKDGTTTVETKKGVFIIDTEDARKISEYYWRIEKDGYVTGYCKGNRTNVQRLIMNCPDEMCVDHINRDKRDNRKENLRICTIAQNNMNHSAGKNNKSGYVGVIWKRRYAKWEAYITLNRKTYYLGRYADINDAIKARKDAEKKYYGEFACAY